MFGVVLFLLQTVFSAQQALKPAATVSQSTSNFSQLPFRRIAKPPTSLDMAASFSTRSARQCKMGLLSGEGREPATSE